MHDVDQRSEAWHALRAGKLTASCAGDMMARIKSGEAAARRDLRTRIVCERLTGLPQEDAYLSRDMQRGIETEAEALAEYEIRADAIVQRVGFLTHPELPVGYSPDGVIGDYDGLLELKCPRAANHLKYLRGRELPVDYRYQVTHALWLTGARYCDFVSYCAQFPEPLRLFRVRVLPKAEELDSYEVMLRAFLAEVEREVEAVQALVEAVA